MFKSIALLVAVVVFFSACNNEAKNETTDQDSTVTTPNSTTTNDTVPKTNNTVVTDEHGCQVDAGEKWSVIKKSCVKLAVDAVKLDPKDPALDPAKPAYLVFDSVRVEIFLPTQARTVIIRKSSGEGEPPLWVNGPLKITFADGMYTLYDEQKMLYQGKE